MGSSVNNVMQRVSSSIAIAVFGSLNISKGAQLALDQAAWPAPTDPAIAAGGAGR